MTTYLPGQSVGQHVGTEIEALVALNPARDPAAPFVSLDLLGAAAFLYLVAHEEQSVKSRPLQ